MKHNHRKVDVDKYLARIPKRYLKMSIAELRLEAQTFYQKAGDAAAIGLMIRASKAIFKEAEPFEKNAVLSDILTKDQIEGIIALNHAWTYLEDRQKYIDTGHIAARGYITVT